MISKGYRGSPFNDWISRGVVNFFHQVFCRELSSPPDSLINQPHCELLLSHGDTMEVAGENMTIHCETQQWTVMKASGLGPPLWEQRIRRILREDLTWFVSLQSWDYLAKCLTAQIWVCISRTASFWFSLSHHNFAFLKIYKYILCFYHTSMMIKLNRHTNTDDKHESITQITQCGLWTLHATSLARHELRNMFVAKKLL